MNLDTYFTLNSDKEIFEESLFESAISSIEPYVTHLNNFADSVGKEINSKFELKYGTPDFFLIVSTLYSIPIADLLKQSCTLMGLNQITPYEYLEYNLYRYDAKTQKTFVGYFKSLDIWAQSNKSDTEITQLNSKILTENVIIQKLGYEYTPHTFYTASDQQPLDINILKSNIPFFGKPDNGIGGASAIYITSYDEKRERFVQPNGVSFSARDIIHMVFDHGLYLFQKPVKSDIQISIDSKSPNTLNTIRFLTYENHIVGAVLKISMNNTIVDNFGMPGNYVVAINNEGITHTVATTGDDIFGQNAKTIEPVQIPKWDEAKVAVQKVSKLFPKTKLLGMDVAITKTGPVVIDVNPNPGLRIMQLPYQQGFYPIWKRLKKGEKASFTFENMGKMVSFPEKLGG